MAVPGTKFRAPALRRQLVPRERLLNLASATTSMPRLLLVAAPAGFGKTTLLSQWLVAGGQADDRHPSLVAWVALDDGDTEVGQFLTNLTTAIRGVADGLGEEALALLTNSRTLPTEEVVASLINDLDEVDGRTVIALDDYHLADSPEVNDAVAFLLDHLPPNVTVAMTTRADPGLPLARLRSRGELLEIRAADLRFTQDEAYVFFNRVMELDLDPESVAALEKRTEGWAAGLQLAALSVRGVGGSSRAVSDFVDSFSGSHRFVLDYLVEEVLAGQSEQTRQFLIATSVLHQLTGELCDRLTGRNDGNATLQALDRGNVFVVPLDEQRQWYRYHHLFADALRARLASEAPSRVRELHAVAGAWYAEQGMLGDALIHASASYDMERTADLVELGLSDLRKRRQSGTIIDWVELVSDDELQMRPLLATAKAWSRLVIGDLDGVERWLDVAEGALRDSWPLIPWADTDHLRDLARARDKEMQALPATIAIYRASIAQARGDVEGTVANARRAAELADPDDHLSRGGAAGFLGLAAWAAGDLHVAVETFGEAVAQLRVGGNIADALGASVVLADMSIAAGRPCDARRLYERTLKTAEDHPGPALAIAADLHVGLADVLREAGDVEQAARHLAVAKELGETASLPENRYRWFVTMARLMVAGGDLTGALEMLDQAEARYLPGFFPEVQPIAASRARIWISLGDLASTRTWAAEHRRADADGDSYLDQYNALTEVRLLLAEHRAVGVDGEFADQAMGLIGRVLESAMGGGGGLVEATMLRGLANAARGDVDAALDYISEAVVNGVPARYVRLFLDEGQPMVDLLAKLAQGRSRSEPAELAQRLLTSAKRQQADEVIAPVLDDALSQRELDVLRLLPTDLTGPEIARQLFISVNTLRTHTKRIFTKLDVSTRRAAVTRAQELGLL